MGGRAANLAGLVSPLDEGGNRRNEANPASERDPSRMGSDGFVMASEWVRFGAVSLRIKGVMGSFGNIDNIAVMSRAREHDRRGFVANAASFGFVPAISRGRRRAW